MKKILLFTISMLLIVSLNAQDDQEANIPLDIKMTEVFKDKKKFTSLAFSTEDGNNGVIIGRRYKKGYYIEHYDSDINLVSNYDFEVDKRRGSIDKAFISGNNLVLIEFLYNKKSSQLEYYINISPKDNFSFKRRLLF